MDDLVDAMEDETVKIDAVNGEPQRCIYEEAVDFSYIAISETELLEEASQITDVGGVLSQLSDRVASCMMRSLCQSVCPSVSIGTGHSEDESIFDPASRMGLEESRESDKWQYDASNASWTRFIVVPRTGLVHPSEGAAEERACQGPRLSEPQKLSMDHCRWHPAYQG